MQPLDKILHRAQQIKARLVLPEGTDPRIIEGALRAQQQGLCQPVLLGPIDQISAKWQELGGNTADLDVIDPPLANQKDIYAQALFTLRAKKGMTRDQAQLQITNPVIFAAMMVHLGDADGTVGGACTSTADIVRAALQIIGRGDGVTTVSSFFLMMLCAPHHAKKGGFIFADCGLIVAPTSEELADIALQSAHSLEQLLGTVPKIAMLSFSTSGSAQHDRVDHVKAATKQVKNLRPDLVISEDVQFDAAFVPEISASKAQSSPVQGDANIMVFPNLDAANIGYKIAQRIGGASAIGPILQGLAKPANDLSRGCSAEDVVNLLAVTSVQAGLSSSD